MGWRTRHISIRGLLLHQAVLGVEDTFSYVGTTDQRADGMTKDFTRELHEKAVAGVYSREPRRPPRPGNAGALPEGWGILAFRRDPALPMSPSAGAGFWGAAGAAGAAGAHASRGESWGGCRRRESPRRRSRGSLCSVSTSGLGIVWRFVSLWAPMSDLDESWCQRCRPSRLWDRFEAFKVSSFVLREPRFGQLRWAPLRPISTNRGQYSPKFDQIQRTLSDAGQVWAVFGTTRASAGQSWSISVTIWPSFADV